MRKLSLHSSNSPPLVTLSLCVGISIYGINSTFYPTLACNTQQLTVIQWILHSLPNGVCFFALLNLYRYFYRKHTFYQNLLWITILTLLAFTTEYLQTLKILSGVFDIVDLLFYEYASLVTIYLAFNTHLRHMYDNLK